MKKIKNFLIENIKTVVAFILGIIISGTTVYAATILFNSNQVGYDNTTSGSSSTNVQDAIDELYAKANTWIDPSSIELDKIVTTNVTKKLFATSNGVCIIRKGKISCFKINNWAEEQTHIQEVFSDISCNVDSSKVECFEEHFGCVVDSDGIVHCFDNGDGSFYSYCTVLSDGTIQYY